MNFRHKKSPRFLISGPKNPYSQNLDAQSAKIAKISLFRGSFVKYPEIHEQRPYNVLISALTETGILKYSSI